MRNKLIGTLGVVVLLAVGGCGQSGSAPESAATEAQGGGNAAAPAPAAAPKPEPITLPAGTAIAITVDQSVSSKDNNAGDRFDASVATPVVVDGKQVIPSGAKASGSVTVAKSAGHFKGNADLAITLKSVTVAGKSYDLHTSTFAEASKSRGKRTAITTGIGAGAGAVIGAIAGGGKGAAIGAGVGAGGGAVGAAATGDRDVDIPAETKVTFKLTQPLTIE